MTILCYHAVQPHWTSPLAITPEAFERQAAWLARWRRVVPLDVAVDRLSGRGRLPRGNVALTFDDGFTSLHEHALPILLRHRLPATVFLVAETLTPAGRPVDWVDTPPPYPLTTLSLDQVLEMQEAGVEFASHSYSHHDLTALAPDECLRDLRASRELLEDLLARPVPYLAYPRGRNNAAVRQAAAKAGYRRSFTLPQAHEPTDSAQGVPRVGVWPGNSQATLAVKTEPAYLGVRMHSTFPLMRRLGQRRWGER
jgi:peptidoglycan/xylan/chitin deacetylase (PgdA/CDA1 family)